MFDKSHQKYQLVRSTSAVMLLIYLAFLSWRMFFYAYGSYDRVQHVGLQYNLIPFKTIIALLHHYHNYDFTVWIYNLLGNIVVFIPLGFLLILIRSRHNIKMTLVISFFIILLAEIMQLILKVGVFDVDDILLNLFGCLIGCLFGSLIRKCIQAV